VIKLLKQQLKNVILEILFAKGALGWALQNHPILEKPDIFPHSP
jgi:hypothetical protein